MVTCVQALLDVYTIQREIGQLDNVRIGLVGDLANGRTARSLAYLMSMYAGVKIYFVAPEVVRMGDDIKEFLDSRDVAWEEADDLSQVHACLLATLKAAIASAITVAHAPLMRHPSSTGSVRGGCAVPDSHSEGALSGALVLMPGQRTVLSSGESGCEYSLEQARMPLQDRPEEYERARGKYIIDNNIMQILPKRSVVMHPLPRVDEVCLFFPKRVHIRLSCSYLSAVCYITLDCRPADQARGRQ